MAAEVIEAGDARGVFDTLAATRPRIRRDVLFTRTPGGVLFHNADGGFHLAGRTAYRFASLIVPHLTGRHRLAELCAGFGEPQRVMATELVRTLYDRGFARDVPESDDGQDGGPHEAVARRFAAQIAYVDHYTDQAPHRFVRFRETAVAVLGEDAVARWCALSLVRNGCARIALAGDTAEVAAEAAEAAADGCPVRIESLAADADWTALSAYDAVVVTGAGAAARVHRLLSTGVPEGKTLIPVWTFGELAVVGPRSTARSAGCWSCAVLRLGGNHDAGAAAAVWSEVAGATAGTGPLGDTSLSSPDDGPLTGPVAAMVGNLLGYEIFRIATGALPAETDRQILVQNTQSLDVVAEPVHPHPRCVHCATRPVDEPPAETPGALAVPGTATVETARDAEAVVDELNRVSDALVRPFAGVFGRFDDEALTQTPLKISRVEVALGHGVRRTIAAFDVHHLAGARTRALYAAAEAYVEHVVPVRRGPADVHDLPEVAPQTLTTGGGLGTAADVTAWTTATSLLSKEHFRVPVAAVRPFGQYNRERMVLATSAGAGAGSGAQEAAGRGLLSALAHDALLRAVGGTASVSPVFPDEDPELVFLLRSAANLGVEVELLDLGEAGRSSTEVVLARQSGPGGGVRWAVAAGLSRRRAACEALRDLLGQVQLAAEGATSAGAGSAGTIGGVDMGDPLVTDLAPGTIAVTGTPVEAGAPATTFDRVLQRLAASGRDVLYVDTTPADLPAGGIRTSRILLTSGPRNGTDAD
ncbi:TOMM precursor leader peptide-binding protein [Streptomyces sp. NBC_01619]|uniref:TOMM precursor leader peptide-binding protein n=1 Tax=Streptomyces sp. NBC_01619 TaxID=2975901 RepID=UPI002258FB6A|nr:TOMM precursor leader peptide-binding protein [Streptomyces sp. NBC_01619]MCX4510742.1 TOMM precursor leader peptide-binding protein [Streptomyces sp. NBC_01619]